MLQFVQTLQHVQTTVQLKESHPHNMPRIMESLEVEAQSLSNMLPLINMDRT